MGVIPPRLHYTIYQLRFYSNSSIHILSLSNSHNNVQKNRGDKSHRVIIAVLSCKTLGTVLGYFPLGGIFRAERHFLLFKDQLAESGHQKTKENTIPRGKFRPVETTLRKMLTPRRWYGAQCATRFLNSGSHSFNLHNLFIMLNHGNFY